MIDETSCDGILIARGAMGSPWNFKDIEFFLKHGIIPKKRQLSFCKKILKKHLSLIIKYKDISKENLIGYMGKVSMWYLKGVPRARRIRDKISRSKN